MAKIPTVTLVLKKKLAADKEGYIKVKVAVPGINRDKFKTTGYKIPAKFWDSENEKVIAGFLNYFNINKQIHKDKQAVIEQFEDVLGKKEFTAVYIANALKPKSVSGEFNQFYLDYIKFLKTRWTAGYIKHFETEYNTLKNYAGEGLMFSDITTQWLKGYEVHLSFDKEKNKNRAKTTVSTKMKRLKEVINHAIDLGHIGKPEVKGFKFPSYRAPDKDYLTMEQTEQVGNLIYSGDLDYNPLFKSICCYFLIECYAGIRFSDWSRFVVEKLIYDRNLKVSAKKNGEPVYLPLNIFTRLAKIVDYVAEHNIKVDSGERVVNSYLHSLGVLLKLSFTLTTHYGRRTCATLLGEMRWSTRSIAEVLGIEEDTAKTYIKKTRQGLNYEAETLGGL